MVILKSKKIKLLIIILLVSICVCLSVKYVLPLLIPFIIAYVIAHYVSPVADWLAKRLHIKKGVIVGIILGILVIIISYLSSILIHKLLEQLRGLIERWPHLEVVINEKFEIVCSGIEKRMGLEDGCVLSVLSDNINSLFKKARNGIMPVIMNTSLPALFGIIDIVIFVVIVFITTFFMAKDMEKIKIAKTNFIFSKELKLVTSKLYDVGAAYLRTQIVIMFITSIICFIGFKILKNPYAMLLSVLMGLLDALPLLGIGIFLIPWTLLFLISGNYPGAIILFITFIICYLVREFLEPKLIGERVGIHPLISILSIYIGYKLFGVIGVIFGPISYIIIEQIIREVYNKLQ